MRSDVLHVAELVLLTDSPDVVCFEEKEESVQFVFSVDGCVFAAVSYVYVEELYACEASVGDESSCAHTPHVE